MTALVLVVVSFVAMEPITCAVHRWIMHGPGRLLHRSHHRPPVGRFEANDLYPVMFAVVVGGAMAVGYNVARLAWLVPVGLGVTLYGVAYGAAHDGHIHRRLAFFAGVRWTYLDHLAEAHRIHHLYGAAPYGMLFPVVPETLRERAAAAERDPLPRRAG